MPSYHKDKILKQVYEANLENRIARKVSAVRTVYTAYPVSSERTSGYALFLFFLVLFPVIGLAAYKLYPHYSQQDKHGALMSASVQTLIESKTFRTLSRDIRPQIENSKPEIESPVIPVVAHTSHGKDYLEMMTRDDLSLSSLFGLNVRTIVIDAGHGGRDPGAMGVGDIVEKDITLDLARRLKSRLEARENYRILMTRDDDISVSLKERVEYANANGADLFISLHVNSLPVEDPMIVETYYFGSQSDPEALRSAQIENQGSDYSLTDFREVIAKIEDSFKERESSKLAAKIQKNLYHSLKKNNEHVVSWGTKTAPFIVLLGADMPAVLTEVSTLSNTEEARRLSTVAYRDKIAGYLESGIIEYLDKFSSENGFLKGDNQYAEQRE